MELTERRAFAGTSAITLLAVAGFCCLVFLPADATMSRGLNAAQESTDAPLLARFHVARALSAGGAFR